MRPWLRKSTVAALSLLAALSLVELAARWYVEGGLVPALASLAGRRVQVELEVEDSWLVPDAELAYTLNPTMPGICSRGYRGEEPLSAARAGIPRVVVLGDSVSFDEGGWPDQLSALLAARRPNGLELINASIPGYTTFQERRLFELRLADLEPELVILQHCLNDNHRLLHQLGPDGRRLLTPEARRAQVAGEGGLLDLICRYSYAAVELRERWLQRRLEVDALQPWDRLEGFRTAWQDESWVAFAHELETLRDAVRARSGRLVVVSFPLESQLVQAGAEDVGGWVRKPQRLLREACDALGVPALDLFDPFREALARGASLYRDGLHLTPAGHGLAADRIAAFLDS